MAESALKNENAIVSQLHKIIELNDRKYKITGIDIEGIIRTPIKDDYGNIIELIEEGHRKISFDLMLQWDEPCES